jgi:antitoxin component YwqK of YwqJK toxin-antitoxin module
MTDKEYYTNGQVFSVIYDGVMTLFYKSGKVKARGGYSNGYKEGKWEYFKEDGTLWQIGHLVNSKKTGLWVKYDENGNTLEKNYLFNDFKADDKEEFVIDSLK